MSTVETAQTTEQINAAVEAARPSVEALKALQAGYDTVGWNIQSPAWTKLRHVLYHLRDELHTLDRLVEAMEHDEHNGHPPSDDETRTQIEALGMELAGLLFGTLQLADLGDVDLVGALRDMWGRNAREFAPDSAYAALPAERYTAPLEH